MLQGVDEYELNVENTICSGWLLRLQQSNGDVVDRYSRCRSSLQTPVMGVTMQYQVCTVAVHHLTEPGTTEKGVDFLSFALDRGHNR